ARGDASLGGGPRRSGRGEQSRQEAIGGLLEGALGRLRPAGREAGVAPLDAAVPGARELERDLVAHVLRVSTAQGDLPGGAVGIGHETWHGLTLRRAWATAPRATDRRGRVHR